jgi:AN1-type zinc finger and ubiquitin domain-containing protein 1
MSDTQRPSWATHTIITATNQSCENKSSFFTTQETPQLEEQKNIDGSEITPLQKPTTAKRRCLECNRKLTLSTEYVCKCNGLYCSKHKFADMHACTYDHKNEWRKSLTEKNPQVVADKISRI